MEWSHVTKMYRLKSKTGEQQRRIGLLDFTASVRTGVTVILGPKGAGKTTLLRLTAATLLPDDGRIIYQSRAGEPLIWSRAAVVDSDEVNWSDWRQKIAYLPAKLPRGYKETVDEVLRYSAQMHRIASPRKYAAECIAKWGLAAWRKYSIAELPHPIYQRFVLATCFVKSSDILLFDEPTKGLDVIGKQMLWQEIMQHRKERIILLATSDLSFAECADDLLLLERGSCRRLGRKKYLTASVREGTVESWYRSMQTFSSVMQGR